MVGSTERKQIAVAAATLALLFLAWAARTAFASGPGTPTTESFTYQGYLEEGGVPASGAYDFRFLIFDAETGGSQVGTTFALDDQPVVQGVFTVYVQPGPLSAVFTGAPRWIQVEMRPGSSTGAYTALPRQPVTAVPYAWGLRPGVVVNAATGTAFRGQSPDGYGLVGYSANGVGVYGRSDRVLSEGAAGVRGWGNGGPGGEFFSHNGDLIVAYEDVNAADDATLNLRFRVSKAGNVHADGTYYGAGGVAAGNADLAERIDASSVVGPGDVVEIAPEGEALFRLSGSAFSTAVAGVISTEPAITMNNADLTEDATGEPSDNRPALALAGVVPVKVTAENGPIAPGDLLVSSSTPGHAMCGGNNPPAGTVIGKALGALADGSGTISMLVMLR